MIHFSARLIRTNLTLTFEVSEQPEDWRSPFPYTSPSFWLENPNGATLMVTSNFYPELWVAGAESPNPDVWLFLRGTERKKDRTVSVRKFLSESAAIRAFGLASELMTAFVEAAMKESPFPTEFLIWIDKEPGREVAVFSVLSKANPNA